MSKLQELIDRLCPNGVEFKPLGEVATLSRGKVYSKEYLRDNPGKYPVYSSQTANDGVLGKIDSFDYDGEYLTWTTDGAYAGTIFHRKGKFSITNVCGLITLNSNNIILRFLYYWLSIEAPKYVYTGMGNPKLMSNQVTPIPIPIPPLEVQDEIVKILDRFADYAAELQVELQVELQARRLQYEYYRNLLLTFNTSAYGCGTDDAQKDCLWLTLKDVAIIKNGKDYKHCNNGDYPVYGSGGIMTYVDQYCYDKPTVILPRKGSIGKIHYLDTPFWNVDTAYYTIINTQLIVPKFLYYFLTTIDLEKKNCGKGAVPSLTQDILYRISIPIPPLELQEKIVAILDRFETLVNDLSKGLPAEIEAVKARYEYYRNKLLTFNPLSA